MDSQSGDNSSWILAGSKNTESEKERTFDDFFWAKKEFDETFLLTVSQLNAGILAIQVVEMEV